MRIRSIKPEFMKNEQVAELTHRQRLLFIGLWMLADKNGCLKCAPRRIKAELFPFDDITSEDVSMDLQKISDVCLTQFYSTSEALQKHFRSTSEESAQDFRSTSEEVKTAFCTAVAEAEFIYIPNFVKHQRITTWEAKNSTTDIPEPKHFRSTSEALQKHFRTTSERSTEVTEVTEERKEGGASPLQKSIRENIETYLDRLRDVHPECEKITEQQFVAALRATNALAYEPSVIGEALDAFERQCCSVTSFRPQTPLGKFENYLKRSIEDSEKKSAAVDSGATAPERRRYTGVPTH
jgi:hypothetical protein